MFSDPSLNEGDGILTGLAFGEHTVLTAAHAFGYDPEPGHPLWIGGEEFAYTIVIDGWAGDREEDRFFEFVPDAIQTDYLVLKTKEPLAEFTSYITLPEEHIFTFRKATLVTRRQDTGEPVAISLREIKVPPSMEYFMTGLSEAQISTHYLSGSPVIGELKDGTRVLVGVVTASGSVTVKSGPISKIQKNQLFITPAYRIPLAEISQ